MAKLVWWFVRGLIYSAIIFAFLYLFIHMGVVSDLSKEYINAFTIQNTIIVSIICGFIFVTINNAFFGKRKKRENERKRR